jgi:hypothetical protein
MDNDSTTIRERVYAPGFTVSGSAKDSSIVGLGISGRGGLFTGNVTGATYKGTAIPYYANKAAARGAGLTSGMFYMTVTAASDTILAIIP